MDPIQSDSSLDEVNEPPSGKGMVVLAFVKRHAKFFQFAFMILILLLAYFVVRNELRTIRIEDLRRISHDINAFDKLKFIALGLLAFSFCSLYDFVFAHRFGLDLRKRDLFSIGWIAQSFNNFVGFGGLTGGTLRAKLYKDIGVPEEKALKISAGILISTLLGLFVLGLVAAFSLVSLGETRYLPFCLALFALVPLYLFGDKLPLPFLRHKHSPLTYLSRQTRFETLGVSALEWLVAALYFAFALRYFDKNIPWSVGILVYTVAIVIGLISMVPGGLGTFDGAVIAIMTQLGYPLQAVLMALLMERLVYTFLPWLLGLLSLSWYTFRNRFELDLHLRLFQIVPRMISYGVFGCGVILLISVLTPGVFSRIHLLYHHLPIAVPLVSKTITALFGVLLIILSRGIRLQVRNANTVASLVLIAAAVTSLTKGLDYEEASIMLIFACILIFSRALFTNPSLPLNRRSILIISVAIAVLSAAYFLVFNTLHRMNFFQHPSFYSLRFLNEHRSTLIVFVLMTILIAVAALTTRRRYHIFEPPNGDDHLRFEQFLEKYDGNMFTHLFYMGDKMLFFNQKGTVMFQYRPVKNHILVLGDPIGDPADMSDALDELIRWAHEEDMLVSFYEIGSDFLVEYIDEGFRFLKLGEDARVDLTQFTVAGKKNRGLRHTRGVMEKEGYTFRKVDPPFNAEQLSAWEHISTEWLGGKTELQFSLGSFNRDYMQRCSVFELVDADGQVQAFANMMSHTGNGVLSIDLMRYRKEAPNAVMDMVFISLFEWGRDEGYQWFDLGVSPLANVGTSLYSGNKEKLARTAYDFGTRIYSFGGLHNFKNKFKPEWKPVYLAYRDDLSLADVLFSLISLIHKKSTYLTYQELNEDEDRQSLRTAFH